MKKLLFTLALVMGLGTSLMVAQDTAAVATETVASESTSIEIANLPSAITSAISSNYPSSVIKEASVSVNSDGAKIYKVVLASEDGSNSTVSFTEGGEIVK